MKNSYYTNNIDINRELQKLFPEYMYLDEFRLPQDKSMLFIYADCYIPFAGELRGTIHLLDSNYNQLDGKLLPSLDYEPVDTSTGDVSRSLILAAIGKRGQPCMAGIPFIVDTVLLRKAHYIRCSFQALLLSGAIATETQLCRIFYSSRNPDCRSYPCYFLMGGLFHYLQDGIFPTMTLPGYDSTFFYYQLRNGIGMTRDSLDVMSLSGGPYDVERQKNMYYQHCIGSLDTWTGLGKTDSPAIDVALLQTQHIILHPRLLPRNV